MKDPYVNHPVNVAFLLSDIGGVSDDDILIAALLHDTVEDTNATFEEISALFGDLVSELVRECTDDKSLPKEERKALQIVHSSNLSSGAKLIKLADKICNLQSILEDPPEGWSRRRKLDYFIWAGQVGEGLVGENANLDGLFADLVTIGKAKLTDG